MPFKSKAQRRWMYSQKPEIAKEWEEHTPKKAKLPEYKNKKTKARAKKKAVHNLLKKRRRRPTPRQIDPTQTIGLRRHFCDYLKKQFAVLKGKVVSLISESDALGLKTQNHSPFTKNGTTFHSPTNVAIVNRAKLYSPTNANSAWKDETENALLANSAGLCPILELPDIRQEDHYSCGAAASMAVGQYFAVGPETIEAWKKALGTSLKESTHPEAIAEYLGSLGLRVEAQSHLTIKDLEQYIDEGMPVICCVQDYGDRRQKGASFAYGHYLTVIGLVPPSDSGPGYVVCQDSSIDNALIDSDDPKKMPDNISAPGRVIIRADTWMRVWHDKDADGKKFIRYGIAVGDGETTENVNPYHDKYGRFATAEQGASSLSAKVWAKGGFTYRPLTGSSPQKGFVVSLPRGAGWEKPIPESVFKQRGKKIVLDYLKGVRDAVKSGDLDSTKAHVGAWHDGKTGRVVLDVNEVYQSKKGAVNAGRSRKQDAIYDIERGQEIDLRGSHTHNWQGDGRGAGEASRADMYGAGGLTFNEEYPGGPAYLVDRDGWQYHTNANPEGCNQHTGPGCGLGSLPPGISRSGLTQLVYRASESLQPHIEKAGEFMKQATVRAYSGLTNRYGKAGAIAILSSGHIVAWGITGASTALWGVPVWAPMSTIWGAIPGIAVAETVHQLRKGLGAAKGVFSHNEEIDLESIAEKVRHILERQWRRYLEAHKEEILAAAATSNVFCPTGESGGIDATCSPATVKRIEIRGELASIYINPSKQEVESIFKHQNLNNPYGELRGMVLGGKAYIWEPTTDTGTEITHDLVGSKLAGDSNPEERTRFWVSDKNEWGRKGEIAIVAKYGGADSPDVVKWAKKIGMVSNVFCPTGPGGGVDSSCSPGKLKNMVSGIESDIKRITNKLDALSTKVPGIGRVKNGVKGLLRGIHSRLEARYGPKTARFIMSSGLLGGYGVSAGAMMLTGTPGIPVVNDLVSIAAHTAAAEAGLQLGRLGKKIGLLRNTKLSEVQASIVQEFKQGLTKLAKEHQAEILRDLDNPEVVRQVKELIHAYKSTQNVFCPTGEGGGIDATCGGSKDVTKEKFHELADLQRDRPETAMLHVQFAYGGGPLNPVVEHAGDLIHRMSERPTFSSAGYEFVKPKVEKLLNWMDHGEYDWKPGGTFGDEVQRSIRSNVEYLAKEDAGRAMSYWTDVKDSLQKYAAEHRKLPAYNDAQRTAKDIAIAVGDMRWGDAIGGLKKLQDHLGSKNDWVKYAHAGLTTNVFCPTGPGGGVDASCSPSQKGNGATHYVEVTKAYARAEKLMGCKEPCQVGDDIKVAAILLAQGKRIQLSQPEQVSTLLDRMAKMVRRSQELGTNAPNFDLCKVSVPGTNLFCQESLGIPRVKMPQMRGMAEPGSVADTRPKNKAGKVDIGEDFINHLREKDIQVTEERIPASHLRASQSEIVGSRVAQMLEEVKAGTRDLRERPIWVTKDNYVLDGHHHWAAVVGEGYSKGKDLKIPVYKLNIDIGTGIDEANRFAKRMGLRAKIGTSAGTAATTNALPIANTQWLFHPDPEKIKAFQTWLKAQTDSLLTGKSQEELWQTYIQRGFQKGAGRAFDDVKQSELRQRRPELFTPEAQGSLSDFYAGSKEEFLRSSFNQPVSVERVKMLAGRTFDEMKNVTTDMANKMSRRLVDGLIQGKGPYDIARDLTKEIDISKTRAEAVARTELVRAHGEGQLRSFDAMGVSEIGVAVEWDTADDGDVCELCEAMDGVILSIEEASGMIPRHVNCRCAYIPANVGENKSGQVRTAKGIRSAISESASLGGGWPGAVHFIKPQRPESIINAALLQMAVENAFCPTGEGGGVDASCSPHGKGAEHEHIAGHTIEHIGHNVHDVHEAHEVAEALGAGDIGHAAVSEAHGAYEEAAEAGHEGHSPSDAFAIVARRAYNPALKAVRKMLDKVPGAQGVARTIGTLHDGATKMADIATKNIVDRYGTATAGLILGVGSSVGQGAGKTLGLPSAVSKAIPGAKFVGAIPMLALAEAGKRLGVVGHGARLEKGLATAGTWIHAIKASVGGAVSRVAKGVEKAGLMASRAAGKTTREILNPKIPTGNEILEMIRNGEVKLSAQEIRQISEQFYKEYMTAYHNLFRQHAHKFLADGKSTENARASFLAECHRDEHGWCEAGPGEATKLVETTRASKKELIQARVKAIAKAQELPQPSEEDIKANEGIKDRQIRGNKYDRARSRDRLLSEFGDGKSCPCIYCGLNLTEETVTRDKIYTTRQGGRYKQDNLVPSCLSCNRARGDVPFKNIKWEKP